MRQNIGKNKHIKKYRVFSDGFFKILAAVDTSGCFGGFSRGSVPLYERSTSLIQAQPGANRLVSDYRMFCFGPVPTRLKAKFCPSLS